MSKKKRLRRDIEKFHRSGRYWELLRLLESENAVADHVKEHKEGWQALTRQAVKQSSSFERFCAEVESLRKYPADPDFRFLMLLKGFVENRNSTEPILQLKGLTPGAEKLRSNFAAFASESMQSDTKLKVLLEKFTKEPDKITRRYYEQLAGLLPDNHLKASVSHLGEYIPSARSLNGKAAVSRGWNGFPMASLKTLDRKLDLHSRDLPPALQDIVLHPFVHNLAVLCRRLAPETGSQQGARFIRSIPFLLPRLAGERAAEIKGRLLPNLGPWSEGTDRNPASLQEELKGLGLEAKVALLARLRLKGGDLSARAERFDIPDLFDEDEDDLEQEERLNTIRMAKTVLMVHRSILGDLSVRSRTLPPRDKRELSRVMEPILCTDLNLVVPAMEGSEEFAGFLGSILDAGCAGARMGLLGLLAGASYRDRDLQKRAEKLLDEVPEPAMDDVKWLADEWIELYYPSARSLRPLLRRYANRRELMLLLVTRLCSEAELDLVEFTAKSQLPDFMASLFEEFLRKKSKDLVILRRELAELNEYDVLNLARLFLGCYPEDRLTMEGHLCWFNACHSARPEGFWHYLHGDLRRYGDMQERSEDLFPGGMFRKIQSEKIQAILLFMKEHAELLPTVPMDALGPLLDELLHYPQLLTRQYRLLIHLNNLLHGRLEAGHEAARPVLAKIQNILSSLAKPPKKAVKTRRKRQ